VRDAEAFRSLPVTTKEEVVADCAAHPPYGSRTVGADTDIRHVVETSGTSGRGREVYALDEADEAAILQAEAVGFSWLGVREGTRVLHTLPVGITAAGLWYYWGLRLLGGNVFCAGSYPTERKVDILQRYRPEVLVGTPSYLQRLAAACEQRGLRPGDLGVRALLVAGEPFGVHWANGIEQRWGGARLHEQYGCTERAFAWTCPGGVLKGDGLSALHFPPEHAYIEILDPSSKEPVADGHCGELLVTPLRAWASPLLRFATRDRVRYVGPGSCPCGSDLPGIAAGDVQRYDDMIKVRGVNVWPRAVDAVVLGLPGVAEYRSTVQRTDDGQELIELRVEPSADAADDLVDVVASVVRRTTGLNSRATRVAPGEITGSIPEGFVKISRWRDLRRETPTAAVD
jgi:phenylacetate-CoA ligase